MHDHTLRLLTIIKGHKLTGVTPVAKTDQRSQASHHEPNQLDSNPTDPTQPYPI
jgi:hypothetical protein